MKDRRILLVEDNPDDEMLTLEALKEAKIDAPVDVVRDGEEALNFVLRKGQYAKRAEPLATDVIILDLQLPKIDGLEVLKEIRSNKQTSKIPVVILSSSNEKRDVMAGYDRVANSFVVKPIDRAQFEKVVSLVGHYWCGINETP